MKWLSLLFILSCSVTSVKIHNNKLKFKEVPQDDVSMNYAKKIIEKLSLEEKENILKGYVRFYKFALKKECNIQEQFLPGQGIPSLQLPPLNYVDVNPKNKDFISQNTFSFMDIGTDLETQQYYYFGQEAYRAESVFFDSVEPPPLLKEGSLHLMLMRMGVGKNKKFSLCAIHSRKQNLCVEDKLTSQFVDINDKDALCSWVSEPLNLTENQKENTLNYVVRVLKSIEILN